jgi:[protein-PII] uridylyltransferase
MPPTFSYEELQAHFANLPSRYFQINNAPEILTDLTQAHRFMQLQLSENNGLSPVVSWHNEPDRGYTTVHVCTWDRAGLFSKITGSLSAAGLNILSAEIITRGDGIILDTFFVTDAKTGLMARREEREQFEMLLNRILTGEEVDLAELIAQRKGDETIYKFFQGERLPTVIHFDNETSETRTIVQAEAEDRVGLLYAISQVLNDLDLDIYVAKISTEKGAAIDSFYIAEEDGGKITDPERQKTIERKLRAAIHRLGN